MFKIIKSNYRNIPLAMVFILLAIPVQAQEMPVTTNSNEALAYYECGVDFIDHLYRNKAEEAFRKAVQTDPSFVMALLHLAISEPEVSKALLNRAVAVRSVSSAEQQVAEAVKAAFAGNVNNAISILKDLLSQYPDDYTVRLWLGSIYRNQSKNAQWEVVMREGHRRHPDRARFLNALGYALMRQGKFEEAEAALDENIRRFPDEPNVYDSYGDLLMAQKKYGEAAKYFERVVAIHPDFLNGASANKAVRAHIEKANIAFETTFARADAEGMGELYTADAQLFPSGSRVISGREAVAGFWQAVFDMGITDGALETVEVENHGETAIEVGKYILSGANGQVMDRGKYIVVWKKEDGRWKLHRDIWNTSVAPGTKAPTVLKRTIIRAPADEVWQTIRDFGGLDRWHAAAADIEVDGSGVGAYRTITLPDGGEIYERLEHRDDKKRTLRYALIRSPLPVKDYTATMIVRPLGDNRSEVTWKATFAANGAPMAEAQKAIAGIFEVGFDGLKKLH